MADTSAVIIIQVISIFVLITPKKTCNVPFVLCRMFSFVATLDVGMR